MRIDAEFVVQDGECGQQIFGLRTDVCGTLQPDWCDNWIGWHCENMAKELIRGVDERMDDGKLWEGAYLVTHPDDVPDM